MVGPSLVEQPLVAAASSSDLDRPYLANLLFGLDQHKLAARPFGAEDIQAFDQPSLSLLALEIDHQHKLAMVVDIFHFNVLAFHLTLALPIRHHYVHFLARN